MTRLWIYCTGLPWGLQLTLHVARGVEEEEEEGFKIHSYAGVVTTGLQDDTEAMRGPSDHVKHT